MYASDTGGRTVQVLPREAQVTGQNRRTKELQLQRGNVHYIPALHWAGETGRKTHKKSPLPGGTHTGWYNMILVVQTVQQSTRPCIIFSRHRKGEELCKALWCLNFALLDIVFPLQSWDCLLQADNNFAKCYHIDIVIIGKQLGHCNIVLLVLCSYVGICVGLRTYLSMQIC